MLDKIEDYPKYKEIKDYFNNCLSDYKDLFLETLEDEDNQDKLRESLEFNIFNNSEYIYSYHDAREFLANDQLLILSLVLKFEGELTGLSSLKDLKLLIADSYEVDTVRLVNLYVYFVGSYIVNDFIYDYESLEEEEKKKLIKSL